MSDGRSTASDGPTVPRNTSPKKRASPAVGAKKRVLKKYALPQRPQASLALVRRARKVNRVLAQAYPDARCELNFSTPFQLLIATVLSAQTTDVRINALTPGLFARYPDAQTLAQADREELETLLKPSGFYRAKTANVLGLSQALCQRFGGHVPDSLEELVSLPGVGRKTAQVVLGNAFSVPGITVDTHVGRLARRLHWTTEKDPVLVEADVAQLFPRAEWTQLSHRLIFHGRTTCFARRPACGACPIGRWCPSYGIGPLDPDQAGKLRKNLTPVEQVAAQALTHSALALPTNDVEVSS